MTEQEIVDYLKKNKETGIAFGFMPKEVKEWCSKNDSNLVYYSVNGTWFSGDNRSIFDMNEIVALPDTYELPIPKYIGGWVEFEILQDSRFRYFATDNSVNCYLWHEWSRFLAESFQEKWGFTNFGGWQYESNGYWLTEPQIIGKEVLLTTLTDYNEDCRPAIPVRIRFWREKQ